MRLRWAKTVKVRKCIACTWAAFCLYISSVHVIISKIFVPACLQNPSSLTMCYLHIFAKFGSGWPPAIQLATRRMQISISRLLAGCKLHPASGHAIQNT
jgi:hypothetical protein